MAPYSVHYIVQNSFRGGRASESSMHEDSRQQSGCGAKCVTIPIFGANFESCYIQTLKKPILQPIHTPEPGFSADSIPYGGMRSVTIPKNSPKSGSCYIYRGKIIHCMPLYMKDRGVTDQNKQPTQSRKQIQATPAQQPAARPTRPLKPSNPAQPNPTVNGLPSPTGYPPDTCRNPVRSTAPHRTRNRCRAIPAARAPLRTGSPATPPR